MSEIALHLDIDPSKDGSDQWWITITREDLTSIPFSGVGELGPISSTEVALLAELLTEAARGLS